MHTHGFMPPSQSTDKIEFVATEHFWMSGMYWGLSAMALLGRLEEMDLEVCVASALPVARFVAKLPA